MTSTEIEAEAEQAHRRTQRWFRAAMTIVVITTGLLLGALITGNPTLYRLSNGFTTLTLAAVICHLQAKVQLLSVILRGILEAR